MASTLIIHQAIQKLFKTANIPLQDCQIERIHSGGNNKSYCVKTAEQTFFVKHYFTHNSDTRDRLTGEYIFSHYAAFSAPGMSPKPFAKNDEDNVALYEFIEGRSFSTEMLGENEISKAALFFCRLNDIKNRAYAHTLGVASEACFSVRDHVNLVTSRLSQLKNIKPKTEEDISALALLNYLDDIWQSLLSKMNVKDIELTQEQRCISPSDFGFHNALKTEDGAIRFIDFEYAGWDDPAKMICDFFAQIKVPVPDKFWNFFIEQIMKNFSANDDTLLYRVQQLRLVYRIKWCCIALNIFLPQHMARRKFANAGASFKEIKRTQLDKTRYLIQSLEKEHGLY